MGRMGIRCNKREARRDLAGEKSKRNVKIEASFRYLYSPVYDSARRMMTTAIAAIACLRVHA